MVSAKAIRNTLNSSKSGVESLLRQNLTISASVGDIGQEGPRYITPPVYLLSTPKIKLK